MYRLKFQVASLLLLACVTTAAAGQERRVSDSVIDDGIVIEDVTLISPERAAPLAHAAVVIRDGKIAQIGSGLKAGPEATGIDGRGRYLIPGLIDSHVHVAAPGMLDDDAIQKRLRLCARKRGKED